MRILTASLVLVVSLTLTTNFSCAETSEPDKQAAKIVAKPLLEAFYQEIDGRPILTVMLTNVGQEPFAVVNPFEAFYLRIEALDSRGVNLLNPDPFAKKKMPERNLIALQSQQGIHCRIDLIDGFVTWAVAGHSFPDNRPAVMQPHHTLVPDDVSKIHKIRVTLLDSPGVLDPMFPPTYAFKYVLGIDIEKENVFMGQRQILEIPLGEKVDRTVPQFGQLPALVESAEQPKNEEQRRTVDDPRKIVPTTPIPPPLPVSP